MSWENLIQNQSIFSLAIILLNSHKPNLLTIYVYHWENWCWSLLGLKRLTLLSAGMVDLKLNRGIQTLQRQFTWSSGMVSGIASTASGYSVKNQGTKRLTFSSTWGIWQARPRWWSSSIIWRNMSSRSSRLISSHRHLSIKVNNKTTVWWNLSQVDAV